MSKLQPSYERQFRYVVTKLTDKGLTTLEEILHIERENRLKKALEYPKCVKCGGQLDAANYSYGACQCGEEVPVDV